MTYNTNNIESMSIGVLKAYIASSKCLEESFSSQDKGILWDGDIKLFGDEKIHSKETFLDRIPVQIKGHEVKRYPGNKCSYYISIIDLQHYLQDGGIIYFEVLIKNNKNFRIYYKILLPANIQNYIKSTSNKKEIAVEFKQLNDNNPDDIESVCNFFLNERKKQIGKKILMPDEWGNYDALKIEGLANATRPDFINDESFSYVEKNGELFPVILPEDTKFSTQIKLNVSVKGNKFFDQLVIEASKKEKTKYKIGDCLSISYNKNKIDIKFDSNATLAQIKNDTDFLRAFLKERALEINDKNLLCNINFNGFDKFSSCINCVLDEVAILNDTIEYIGLPLNISFSSITNSEKDILLNVKRIIEENLNENEIGFKRIKVGSKQAIVFMTNEKGNQLLNAFDPSIYTSWSFTSEVDNVGMVPTSPYLIITPQDLISADNFNAKVVADNISSINFHPELTTLAINYLLNILKCYDDNPKEEVLELAEAFYENKTIFDSAIAMYINKYQIIKRKRKLNEEEIKRIIELKTSNSDNLEFVCCANLLIDSITEFEYYFKQLNDDLKKRFIEEYPIMIFYPHDKSKLIEIK